MQQTGSRKRANGDEWVRPAAATPTSGAAAGDPVAAALQAVRERDAGSVEPLDLRGLRLIRQDLSGANLACVDLGGADLSEADLTEANLFGANLEGAVLYRAVLDRAEFSTANLRGANLTECRGSRVGFGATDLEGARLFNARLESSTFSRARLCRAEMRTGVFTGSRLHEADLAEADLTGADLRETDMEGVSLAGAVMRDADLRAARLRGITGYEDADWIGCDIRDINFTGAYLLRRFVLDQNFLEEFRTRSRAHAIVHAIWSATSDCGRSLMRWGLWTLGLATFFAGLYLLCDMDYGAHETWLSPFYFSVVTLTTLGYGDVLPASPVAQTVSMAEVVMGYVMLGGLITIFSNKLARRAD